MQIQTLKTLTRTTGILSIVLAVLSVISMIGNAAQMASGKGVLQAAAGNLIFTLPLGLVGLATFILAIILLANFGKFQLKKAGAVLALLAGIFAWLIVLVALVLAIIAAALLLRLKIAENDETNVNSADPLL
jgi:hypothetical protein